MKREDVFQAVREKHMPIETSSPFNDEFFPILRVRIGSSHVERSDGQVNVFHTVATRQIFRKAWTFKGYQWSLCRVSTRVLLEGFQVFFPCSSAAFEMIVW